MNNCSHKDFAASVEVNRLEDVGRFSADVQVECAECGRSFRFIGLPCGVDLNGAAVNIDGTVARLAIASKGEVVSEIEGAPSGFTVRKEGRDAAAEERARALCDQVKKTWDPPSIHGEHTEVQVAQTCTMQAIAWCFGKEFLGELTGNQEAAIDSGLKLMHSTLKRRLSRDGDTCFQ